MRKAANPHWPWHCLLVRVGDRFPQSEKLRLLEPAVLAEHHGQRDRILHRTAERSAAAVRCGEVIGIVYSVDRQTGVGRTESTVRSKSIDAYVYCAHTV